jgi:hypothetical protein
VVCRSRAGPSAAGQARAAPLGHQESGAAACRKRRPHRQQDLRPTTFPSYQGYGSQRLAGPSHRQSPA